MKIPFLSQSDLEALNLSTQEIVDSIEKVIRAKAAGTVWAAPKAVVTPPNDQRYMMAALAAMDDPSLLAVKTVVLNPDNTANGLPQINGLVTMLDSVTGLPAAVMDGNWITAVRTAGLSAAAARRMAHPEATTIGFVGCGVQAQSHLNAFSDIFPLSHAIYYGRGQANQDKLAALAKERGMTSSSCCTGQEVVENCDLLVTTVTHTGGDAPFLDASGMRPGAFAAIVDLGAPWKRESFGMLDRVVIDDLAQEAALPNKLCDPELIHADLSQLILSQNDSTTASSDRTAFIFRGHALGDLALAVLALERHHNITG
ncbi:L-lysine cyclodeaminase [Roseovarius albus]|uniref:L-lysine cyclodeaminase n=1 Tax=Roseovarius albus TaxID=1247867 RepID=A0A1X6YXA2_9RHOB|nr:ornithine cyclodeaminase family protein [Roseovarius albus]SLN34119.1 L-lysine cyclodeaminase [Roseovarius albus]